LESIKTGIKAYYIDMFQIVEKRELGPKIKLMKVAAPLVAAKSKPGQFIVIRVDEEGERIPLTIADNDTTSGTITMVFLEVGKTTTQLGQLDVGNHILDVVGPLGIPAEIKNHGTVVTVGGGVGTAAVYPEARELKRVGNYVISIIGARSANLLVFENEMRNVSDELYITTDDGTKGHKGFVSDVLKTLINKGTRIDHVITIGPTIMMKVVADVTRPYNIKTTVSLNPIMVDGTGMCGACRVSVGGETKFTCVDGPEFDGHLVDFNLLMTRQRMYATQEKVAVQMLEEECRAKGK
jgi:ferredoxin--NADP+ reductase